MYMLEQSCQSCCNKNCIINHVGVTFQNYGLRITEMNRFKDVVVLLLCIGLLGYQANNGSSIYLLPFGFDPFSPFLYTWHFGSLAKLP